MELNKYYDYFFDNKGKCPTCGSHLIMHEGCINYLGCGECKRRTYKDKVFAIKRWIFSVVRVYFSNRDKIYVKMSREKKNLDKGVKKYHNINEV